MTIEEKIEDVRCFLAEERKKNARLSSIGKRIAIERDGFPEINIILHEPEDDTKEKRPLILSLHGGAWIFGDAIQTETLCDFYRKELHAVVANVNYKKGDEEPFPYQFEEVADLVKYFIKEHEVYRIDPGKIVLAGYSAGANLAAGTVLKLHEEGVNITCQVLVYPAVDLTRTMEEDMEYIQRMLFPDGKRELIYASPIKASDEQLKGIAPAIIVVCGKDFLRQQGIEYTQRLVSQGTQVVFREYPEAEHGFLEVNRKDYPGDDQRKNAEQEVMCRDCEQFLVKQLRTMLS